MGDRTIAVPGQGGGPASYTLAPGETFTLRSATWRQYVYQPVSALAPAIPELLAYSPEGLLIARISAPAVIASAPTVPTAPTLTSAVGKNVRVNLTWTPPSSTGGSPITNYKIYRGVVSGGETLLATIGNLLGYADTAVVNNTTYFYKVAAVNALGEGPQSNELSATPNSIMLVTFNVSTPADGLAPSTTFPVTLVTDNNPRITPISAGGNRYADFTNGFAANHHAILTLNTLTAGALLMKSSVAPFWTSTLGPSPLIFNAPGTYTFDMSFQSFAVLWLELGFGAGSASGSLSLEYF